MKNETIKRKEEFMTRRTKIICTLGPVSYTHLSLLGLPRAMWAGIACMSVCLPFTEDGKMRAVDRGVFNIAGCALFLVLYLILPE